MIDKLIFLLVMAVIFTLISIFLIQPQLGTVIGSSVAMVIIGILVIVFFFVALLKGVK